MYIGEVLKSRMKALDMDLLLLADKSFVDQELIEDILDNKLDLENIDSFDLELISKSLYCEVEYFINGNARNKDMIHSSMKKRHDDVKSNKIKGKLQVIASDFIFLRQMISEIEIINKNQIIEKK